MKAVLQWLREGKRIWWGAFLGMLALCALLSSLNGEGGSVSSGASQEERRIAQVLSAMAGAGRVEVALFYENQGATTFGASEKTRPTGAVVVAEGAGNLQVRLELARALRTLLGLSENAVDVFVMEEVK